MSRASKSGINVRDPISGPKCPDNIFGEKRPINLKNNEPYSVYTLYYDKLGKVPKSSWGGGCLNLALLRSNIPTPPKNGNIGLDPP